MVNHRGRGTRVAGFAMAMVAVLALGAGIGWAVSIVFMPKPVIEDVDFTLVSVEEGNVESSLAVNASAVWPRNLVAVNSAIGIVTSVSIQSATPVEAGTVIYSVDLNPVIAMQGDVPSFRDLSQGTTGADVLQLQEFLSTKGYLAEFTPGTFEWTTWSAVQAWQRDAGMPVDGVINAGEVVFVPKLPSGLALDTEMIRVGTKLMGGEEAVYQLGTAPDFILPVSSSQASSMPVGSRVEITSPEGEKWQSWIIEQVTASDSGGVDLVLGSSVEGSIEAAICGDQCDQVPFTTEGRLLRSRVVTVDRVSGLVLPSAAITTTATGQTVVVDETGELHEVTIVAGARGMTVVEGIERGMKVRAPAEAP